MGDINAHFYEKNENVESACKCVKNCSKIMSEKYLWNECVAFNSGYDTQNGDVLFFFESKELLMKNHSKYATEFLYLIREAWKEDGFSIIEERLCMPRECRSITHYSYFFRLRKRNVICKCALCKYSEYDRCSNPNILDEFENITLVKEVVIESSRFNCFQFSECPDAYDVE